VDHAVELRVEAGKGTPGKSRMMFAFDGGTFKPARSYEEDVLPTLKWIDQ
jgi:hypothetical protein